MVLSNTMYRGGFNPETLWSTVKHYHWATVCLPYIFSTHLKLWHVLLVFCLTSCLLLCRSIFLWRPLQRKRNSKVIAPTLWPSLELGVLEKSVCMEKSLTGRKAFTLGWIVSWPPPTLMGHCSTRGYRLKDRKVNLNIPGHGKLRLWILVTLRTVDWRWVNSKCLNS